MTDQHRDQHYEQQQVGIFDCLVQAVSDVLGQYGRHDSIEPGDYSVYEDYWGYPQVKVSIANLKMLESAVIKKLQQVIKAYPGWEVVVAVVNRNNYKDWPEMGLYIRPDEIIDGLQRQYFPKEFQKIEYEGARRGTVDD
jgi:hypothetical protein